MRRDSEIAILLILSLGLSVGCGGGATPIAGEYEVFVDVDRSEVFVCRDQHPYADSDPPPCLATRGSEGYPVVHGAAAEELVGRVKAGELQPVWVYEIELSADNELLKATPRLVPPP